MHPPSPIYATPGETTKASPPSTTPRAADDAIALLGDNEAPASVAFVLNSVWDDRYVEKVAIARDNQGWKCGWCGVTFKTQHATYIIHHLLKIHGQHITLCKAIIPTADLERYQAFQQKSLGSASARKQARDDIEDFINNCQEVTTELVLVSEKNGGQKSSNAAPTIATFYTTVKKAAGTSGGKRKETSLQLSIDAAVQTL